MRITYNEAKTAASYEWDTFDEWYTEYQKWVKTPGGQRHFNAHGKYGDGLYGNASFFKRWFGHEDGFDATLKAIDSGWPEMRAALLQRMQDVELELELELGLELPVFPSMTIMRRRKRVWTDQGDRLDMSRVWNGNVETAWQRPVRTEKMQPNTKRVTLAFDVSDNGNVSNEQAMWRAALSLLLCDSLCKAGRVFEVWCIDSTSIPFAGSSHGHRPGRDPNTLWSGWMVKGSGDPVVLDRLAGMLGVGFLRTVGFMAQGMGPHIASSGLGAALHRGLPHTLAERRKTGEVVIRISGCYTKQQAIEHYRLAWEEVEKAACGEDTQEGAA